MPRTRVSNATVLRVPFGLRDDRMWLPCEVSNGLACGCHCPSCGQPLLAKNAGARRRAHFSHHIDHTCSGAFESAVHRMAKQLICERLRLVLPAWNGAEGMPNPIEVMDDNGGKLRSEPVDFPARESRLRRAAAETTLYDYRPDVVAEDDEGELLIEIRVSHAVGDLKARNVRSEGRRMIEIDLSRVTSNQAEDPAEFERLVLATPQNRTWIACPRATEAWRAARDDLHARLAVQNRNIAEQERRRREVERHERQQEQEQEIWRDTTRVELRAKHAADLEHLMLQTTAEAISAKYAKMLARDEGKAKNLLSLTPSVLHSTLRSSSGPAWAYGCHYMLWQPAMYLQFIDCKPHRHPISRMELGRWLRATYGVDLALWRLFMAQWKARKDAQQRGEKKWSLSLWYFTAEENRAIPNFFHCVTGFVDRLVTAGVLESDPEQGGDLVIAATGDPDHPSIPPQRNLSGMSPQDPFLETGVDPYIDRQISHTRLGVGIIRHRTTKGSPNYAVWFNDSRWRTVWLGDPNAGDWRLLGEAESQGPAYPDSDFGSR